jgi:hypothetical protein
VLYAVTGGRLPVADNGYLVNGEWCAVNKGLNQDLHDARMTRIKN